MYVQYVLAAKGMHSLETRVRYNLFIWDLKAIMHHNRVSYLTLKGAFLHNQILCETIQFHL